MENNENQIFYGSFSGHIVEIIINNLSLDIEIEIDSIDFDVQLDEEIGENVEVSCWNGEKLFENVEVKNKSTGKISFISLYITWRVVPDIIRIANWKEEAPIPYQLTINDIEQVIPGYGKNYYEKWNDEFSRNEAFMVKYLTGSYDHAYIFFRLLMDKVEKYENDFIKRL